MGTKYRHLSLDERHAIAGLRAEGQSCRQIAASLGRPASTITRELKRNLGKHVGYQPRFADEQAWGRRWRGNKLSRNQPLQELVLGLLTRGWSPEQIAGRLKLEKAKITVSHETIYRFIYIQIVRTKNYDWRLYLPKAKSKRGRSRRARRAVDNIKDRVCIADRPESVNNRRQPGHWEADLVHPRKSGAAILVAQERTSRFTFLAKQHGKHAHPVLTQLQSWLKPLPTELRCSLTQDNGPEFFLHHQLNPIGIKTYFCDPHSPWQKGGIENMNGRIRRYIPLGTDPDSFTHDDLQDLAQRLNNTPRKCLRFKTPAEVLSKHLLHFKCESTFPPSRE